MTYAAGSIWQHSEREWPRQVVSDDGTTVSYRTLVESRSGGGRYMRCAPQNMPSAGFAGWAVLERPELALVIDTWDESA